MSLNRKEADGTYKEVAGVPHVTKENIGLGKVENKSPEELVEMSRTILSYVTPQMYGAVGDGEHDDTQAFIDCIAENTNIYIPLGTYLIKSMLNIDKAIAISGEESTSLRYGTKLKFEGSFDKALYITSNNVVLKNLTLNGSGTENCRAIFKNNSRHDVEANISNFYENVHVENFQYGFEFETYAFFNSLNKCKASYCEVGFYVMSATTTLLTDCWAFHCNQGYHFRNTSYSNVISCACDGCDIAYNIYNAKSLNFLGCGCELPNSAMFEMSSGSNITITGCYAYFEQEDLSDKTSFLYASGCTVTLIGCIDRVTRGKPQQSIKATNSTINIMNNEFNSTFNLGNCVVKGSSKVDGNNVVYADGYNLVQNYTVKNINDGNFSGAVRILKASETVQFALDMRCLTTSKGVYTLATTEYKPRYTLKKYCKNGQLEFAAILETTGEFKVELLSDEITTSMYATQAVVFLV